MPSLKWIDHYKHVRKDIALCFPSYVKMQEDPGWLRKDPLLRPLYKVIAARLLLSVWDFDNRILDLAEARLCVHVRTHAREDWALRRGFAPTPPNSPSKEPAALPEWRRVESFTEAWGVNPFKGKKAAIAFQEAFRREFGEHFLCWEHAALILMRKFEGYEGYRPPERMEIREVMRLIDGDLLSENFIALQDFFAYELQMGIYSPSAMASALRITYSFRDKIPAWLEVRDETVRRLKTDDKVNDYLQGLL